MPDPTQSDGDTRAPEEPVPPEEMAFVETYDTDDGTVFYDVDNPLAWLESDQALSLDDTV